MAASLENKYIITNYLEQSPYSVLIQPSEELDALLEKAKETQHLPFAEKLATIERLAVNAMKNAFEGMFIGDPKSRELCRSLVKESHSLNEALKSKLGCCRYQATLFFILAFEAKLGSKHYLQSAPINGINTCFNDVEDDSGTVHHVSVFTKSLSDQKYNYSSDPSLFERPNKCLLGSPFLAYTVGSDGQCTLYSRTGCHFDAHEKAQRQMETYQSYLDQLTPRLQSLSSEDPEYVRTQRMIGQCHQLIEISRREMLAFSP